ncbi:unnamed protein product [Caenorhabditis nigoni]
MSYNLPPQNLGNLDPEQRVEFVRATGNEKKVKVCDPDDIPEASTSKDPSNTESDGFSEIYSALLEKSNKAKPKVKKEKIDHEDDIIILDDVVKKEPRVVSKNVNIRDVNCFLKAAKEGNLEKLRMYLRKKIPIDVTDFYSWTATMCAAAEGHFEICKYLLENGADPGVRDRNGMGIVQIAQKNKNTDFVRKLFAYFCNSNPSSNSSEPDKFTFCELCDVFILEKEITNHVSSITHQLNDKNSTGAAPQTGIQIGPSNIGYRLMCASGWTEEQGLGRQSDGHRFPIKTILKRNRAGLGMERLPQKVTHFGPFESSCTKTEKKPVTKRELEVKKKKEDMIAKRFRSDFSDNDTAYDFFK